jgi:hypothetical protein
MARTTGPQKMDRVLRFLIALRDQDLGGALSGAGFSDDDLTEGWSLLRATSPSSMNGANASSRREVQAAQAKLEAWAKRHIDLVEHAMKARFPEDLYKSLYLKLRESTRDEVALTVPEFLKRVAALRGEAGAAARALLEKRGLDEAAIAEARELVTIVQRGVSSQGQGKVDYGEAESAAWRWYLEWSAVARATVEDRRILHRLGLSATAAE